MSFHLIQNIFFFKSAGPMPIIENIFETNILNRKVNTFWQTKL